MRQTEKQHRIDQDDDKFLRSIEMKESELCQINKKDEKERTTNWSETSR